ncbi:MAG: hypothetical protein IKL00_00995, partial [Oscillospiraceae bacterium]|nr:hypothetical protein [Oscillospiraceae bacterium]
MEKITLNTQPADGETWRVKIDTEEITDGLFAVPGEGVTLDASRFASTMDGYDVKQNAKGELLLCNHQTAYAAVSNEDGSTHKMLCCCRETTVEESVACSGFGATCQTKAVCAACGQSYGETNPDVHTFNDDGKCVCGAERDAATTVDLSSLTAIYVISDSGEYIFTGSGSYGIKVESGNPKIVLNNVNISLTDGDYYGNNPINGIHIATTGGTTEILVLGESSITAKAGAGIFVAEGGTVKITGSSREDILIATGASGCSGIGGYVYYTNGSVNCGNIEISNVTVKAFGSDSSMGDRAPAIGGAGNGNCGYITIDNADVYAEGYINPYGYEGSSAIGTGDGWGNREGGTIGEISIINDSKVYVTRGNYCDYIGCCGHENAPAEGVVDATAKSSTIYCYDTTDTTEPVQTLKYGALGGLLKEDGTCEGEHSGGTATCKEQAICGNCGASYGELGGHSYNTSGSCTVCGAACPHSNFDSATGNCKDCEISLAIAKIKTGETTIYYQTADDLRTAIELSGDDQAITLLADFETKEIFRFYADGTENILDLNGHTLTCDDQIVVVNCKLTITGTDSSKILFTGANSSSTGLSNIISVENEVSTIVVGSIVIQNGILRSVYGGVLDLTNATIPEAGLNVILYSDDYKSATYNVSDVLLLPEDYYFFVDGKVVSSYSVEIEGMVLKHTEHSYTYTNNGDGTHDATCSVCGKMVDNEVHTPDAEGYTVGTDGTH